ncbi:hypothetical protein JMUB7514_27910 [Staphylococcus aureus]
MAVQAIYFYPRFKRSMIGISVAMILSLIHISEPTRLRCISYAVFCLKKARL